jgi:hypothetical protein
MRHFLRSFIVAMSALALLTAPCLSVLGPLGVGHAHADHVAHAHASEDAAHDKRHHDHGHEHADHGVSKQDDADTDPLPCCRLCTGWLTKKTPVDSPALLRASATPEEAGAKLKAFIPAIDPALLLPKRTGAIGRVLVRAPSGPVPVYALTERFRL